MEYVSTNHMQMQEEYAREDSHEGLTKDALAQMYLDGVSDLAADLQYLGLDEVLWLHDSHSDQNSVIIVVPNSYLVYMHRSEHQDMSCSAVSNSSHCVISILIKVGWTLTLCSTKKTAFCSEIWRMSQTGNHRRMHESITYGLYMSLLSSRLKYLCHLISIRRLQEKPMTCMKSVVKMSLLQRHSLTCRCFMSGMIVQIVCIP